MPRMTTTTMISINVNPRSRFILVTSDNPVYGVLNVRNRMLGLEPM
jgi:hypothetical protein